MAIDKNAALARLEVVVNTLSTCHVADGFKFDHQLAEQALDYLRGQARGEPHTDETFEPFHEFMCRYNQSFDYVIRGDMHCMIAELAAASVTGRA
ncbi:hypothetical protein [Ferruginivarius sediminum]|uniref:Uncharacterized protein n=1 Tax=Ferruginivarius sediminum TaxID=2661937 RepID=A0A369T7Z0_9PROT|nr:hypothetical protein [Ferruginivarius sediminum]RDD61449.1 hypothetical protein DRB17_13320 [Ferruginivarius sediminum]